MNSVCVMDRSNYECLEKQKKAYFPRGRRSNQSRVLQNVLHLVTHITRVDSWNGDASEKMLARLLHLSSTRNQARVSSRLNALNFSRKKNTVHCHPSSARRVLCRLLTSIFAVRSFLLVFATVPRFRLLFVPRSPSRDSDRALGDAHNFKIVYRNRGFYSLLFLRRPPGARVTAVIPSSLVLPSAAVLCVSFHEGNF